MTESAFFASKEDRWGHNMMALWGNLNICPRLNYLELPYHTSGELLSISHLKIWGDIQEPCNDMAYLLVHTGDASGAENYGLALVWISPHQTWASTMEEAVGTLSTCISSGPNWPYVLAQLYEGSNQTPLPKGKHLGILPQGRWRRALMGGLANLKSASSYLPGHKLSIWWAWMGVTSWLPLTYQNHCIAALVSLLASTHIWELTFPYFPLRSQSAQLCH